MVELQARQVGETQRLFRPLVATLEWIVARIGWIVGAVAIVYLVSGVTFVAQNEVALVLRFGRLVGDTPAERVHGPGLLVALPFPIDRVVRVPIDLVREVRVTGLDATDEARRDDPFGTQQGDRIDPEVEGYTVTGDRFVMQTRIVARYRVADPVAFALGADAEAREQLINDVVQAAAAEAFTHYSSSELFQGLAALPVEIERNAQTDLDALDSGVRLVEIALRGVTYPRQVLAAVQDVVSAQIESVRMNEDAKGQSGQFMESYRADIQSYLSDAESYADELVQRTTGTLEAYADLYPQYAIAPRQVRDRLQRDGIARIIESARPSILMVPPPADGKRYNDLRFSFTPQRPIDSARSSEPSAGD